MITLPLIKDGQWIQVDPKDFVGKFYWHNPGTLGFVHDIDGGRLTVAFSDTNYGPVFYGFPSYEWVPDSQFLSLEDLIKNHADDPVVIKLLEYLT